LSLIVALALFLSQPLRGDSPEGQVKQTGAKKPKLLLDRYGDPLPAGAVARLGSERLSRSVVSSVAFSPDSKTLASVSFDEVVSLWEIPTGKERRQLGGHRGLCCVAYFPDGQTLVSGGWDNTLRLWQAATGTQTHQLRGHVNRVLTVAVSPDGKLIASSCDNSAARLWEAATGKEVRQLGDRSGSAEALAFCPDGKLVASAGFDSREIWLWDIRTGGPLRRCEAQDANVTSLAFSPDGKNLATGGRRGQLILWEVASAKIRLRCDPQRSPIQCLAFSPDGRTLVSGHEDGRLRSWVAVSGKERFVIQAHQRPIRTLAVAPSGTLVASGSEDGTVLLWDVEALSRTQKDPGTPIERKDLADLWGELASEDAGRAFQAIQALAAVPNESVPFLQQRVETACVNEADISGLVADLDHDRFAVRHKAMRELEALGQQAAHELRAAMVGRPSLEVQRRVEKLLGLLPAPGEFRYSREQLRIIRAVEVLERIGTPAAKQALKALAAAKPGTLLRQEAAAALERSVRRAR
jgi:dipeptidyl aminopeptidase/acylaminoacyl peptidase